MQLLQIWAWSRIITITSIPSTINTELRPTIIDEENILPHPPYTARWSYHISQTHAAHNAVRIIRNTFYWMKQNEFIWTSYGGEGPDVQSLPWYALRTPWHIKCPLIHYAIVEIHHPEHVLRHFGIVQDIPPNSLISERRLHTLDRRRYHEQDWASYHRDYVVKWYDVQPLMVVRPEVENGRDTVPDYMNWYHQITRIQISYEIDSENTPGYRPVNISDVGYLAERVGQIIIDYNNAPTDYPSVRQLMASHHQTHQEIMNFLDSRYPPVYSGAAPYNSTNEAGPSNAWNEAGPSNARNEAGPSTQHTPTNMAYPSNSDMSDLPFVEDEYAINPVLRRHYVFLPVPFEDLDSPSQNTEQRQEQPARRNRRRP
ncbi:UNVERIFIED_CONTAM: hypothetical protein Slati_0950000 [Sesamum latifolium]|uniref:Aminotransferase-like plant mobile domain-containing protein n=1 Tax=Sesamum latifolium TaxID=2727402 RepID=A0AAW2XQI5_9LAMI